MLYAWLLLLLPVLGTGLRSSSLLWSLTKRVHSTTTSTGQLNSCTLQLLELHRAEQDQQVWALKVYDASGQGYENYMLGNNHWMGDSFACDAVNEHMHHLLTRQQEQLLSPLAPFAFDYRLAYVRLNSSLQLVMRFRDVPLLHIGLCVPSSCAQWEMEHLLRQTLEDIEEPLTHAQLVYTKRPQRSIEFLNSNPFRVLLTLLGTIAFLTFLGTSRRLFACSRILACFDAVANWQQLWQLTDNSQEEITVISGVRSLSAFGIFIFHVIWYKILSTDNTAYGLQMVASASLQHSYMPLLLENFFFISGFLTVINFLRNKRLQDEIAQDTLSGNLRRLLRQLLLRYLRLTPLQCIIVMLTGISFAYHRRTSFFHISEPLDEICMQHGWQNLLYVQNIFGDLRTMCCNWTWSLGCDMQVYILTLLLLYSYTRHPKAVQGLVLLLPVASIVYTVYIMVLLDVQPNFDAIIDMKPNLYISTFVRLPSYMIGIIYGYIHVCGHVDAFYAMFANKVAKAVLAVILLWMFRMLTFFPLINAFSLAIIALLARTLAALAVGKLILSSFNAEKRSVAMRLALKVLQSKSMQRLSRVSYAIYLLNPVVILHFNYLWTKAIPSDISIFCILTLAYAVILFGLSYFLTLFFEIPFKRLTNLLFASNILKCKIH